MPATRRSRLVVCGVALMLAWAIGGCSRSFVVGADRTLRVALSEYRVSPQSVRMTAGPVTFVVHNYGRLTHDLVISMHGRTAGATRPIWPGQTGQLILTLTPGSYLMASTILGDQALGTYGTLHVS